MLEKLLLNKQNLLFYSIAVIFIGITTALIINESFVVLVVPFALIIGLFAIYSYDILFYIAVFFTPLSLTIKSLFGDIGFDLYLPTEILFVIISGIYIVKTIIERKIDYKLATHPVSISIYIYLIWMLITTLTSSMPFVSAKFLISKIWFIIPLFFFGTQIFRETKRIKLFFWLYLISLLIVVIITTIKHIGLGFLDVQVAHFVMRPFFKDHTAYGAILALMIPPLIALFFKGNYKNISKLLIFGVIVLLFLALILSYSRAAWISLIGAFGIWIVVKFKIKLVYLITIFSFLLILFFSFRFEIIDKLEKNKQDSSEQLSEHIQSMSNIATDASNVERLNRWSSAFKMFKERSFFGWGPGTYMFQYAPYQMAKDKTIISTNSGNRGNAHSEYIGPLAESGVFGTLTFILLIITTVSTAIKVHRKTKNKEISALSLAAMLGLITYYLHGFLNNFLDTDKLSVPFWGMMAIIVAIDIYQNTESKT